ncbi:hypothetical protein BG000_010522 [Podila horticola]|nr:hypothetical protein BG000_010522 [Podila horticola]
MVMEEIEMLHTAGINTQADGKDLKQMLEEVRVFEQQVPEWTYQNTCRSMLHEVRYEWEFSTSLFFIVLPSDLDSWDNLDPSTHCFRLYYLCDNWDRSDAMDGMPQHVHLSNHPGYSLKRPEEFFHLYGDYILRVLLMIKRGYPSSAYEIPPLDSLKILWNCDPNIAGSRLTKDTIRSLIERAITYLQEFSPPKWMTKVALDRTQSAAIKTFLDIQNGDNAEGNLYRCTSRGKIVSWKCQAHAQQYSYLEPLEKLRKFVCDHGGHTNMQQGRLGVELGSIAEADQFRTLLKDAKHVFIISIKLCWKPTRLYVKDLCVDIATTWTAVLELDGITPDINPRGCEKHMHNLFETEILKNTNLRLITLINYPRPQEKCMHIDGLSLQSILSSIRPPSSWVELKSDFERIHTLMSEATEEAECNTAAIELNSVLEKHGIPASVVTIYGEGWDAVLDQEDGLVVEVHSQDMACPKGVLSAGSIRTLGVHLDDLSFGEELFQMVRSRTLLQDLSVSLCRHNVLYYVENIVRKWHTSASSFRLTLLDRMVDTQGRIVAQLTIGGCVRDPTGSNTAKISGNHNNMTHSQEQAAGKPLDIVFSQWDCDHVFSQLSDYSASFLSMAAQQHPSALTSVTLDVSRLSPAGHTSIYEFLRRSSLEHLNIVCNLFDPSQSSEVTQALGSVQWHTLKSLVLSGDKIDEWCQLWPSPASPWLLSLRIVGSSSAVQELSHPSVLFLQQLIYASPLVELHLRNVQLQYKRDWALVVDSLDISLLQTLDLGEYSAVQLLSVPSAIDLFISGLEDAHLEAEGPRLVLPSFMLDTATLTQTRPEQIRTILSHCILEKLVVKCALTGLNVPDLVAKALNSVHWSLLGHLMLSGDNVDQWIQFLARIDAPRLNTLQIQGTKLVHQELSHASVLFVERLIGTTSLMKLHFKDVVLQDKRDWVLLVEKMDPSMLNDFDLGDGCHEQFISTPDAVKLMCLKRPHMKEDSEEDSEEDRKEDAEADEWDTEDLGEQSEEEHEHECGK